MKKIFFLCLAGLLVAALFVPDSHAWISARMGQKSFERAWNAFLSKRADDARQYFYKAADAYGLALDENPPSRTTMFPSSLTMAGISAYYGGRYELSVTAMGKAIEKDDSIWEAYIYTAMSKARMDDKAGTIDFLEQYLKSNPGQSILSNEVQKQLTDLQTNSGSLDQAAPALEDAVFRQFSNNFTFVNRTANDPAGLCDGTFWWRYNKAPCDRRYNYNNN
ncbi:MAG: hypothetical protein V3571_07760 [Pseudodesulfovibrio sp.]